MQEGIILDSGAWSILVNPSHSKHKFAKDNAQTAVNCLPVAVVAELYFGAYNQPKRIEIRVREIDNRLRPFKILRPDRQICRIWGELANVRKSHHGNNKVVKDYHDLWIAATALRYGFPVLTTNKRDFLWVDGLKVIEI